MSKTQPQALVFKHEHYSVRADFHEHKNKDPMEILQNLLDHYDPLQVEEIILEDLVIPEITPELRDRLNEFQNVHSLGFNRCDLTSLTNLPDYKNLRRLQLDGNKLSPKQLALLKRFKELKSLSLLQNNLDDMTQLRKHLRPLQKLAQLNLYGNGLPDYRKILFEDLPELKYLDNLNKNGDEIIYEFDDAESELTKQDGYINKDQSVYRTT